ncbi:MAG: hypothetical protein K2O38_05140 [Muribaculaceae bacterium]|nr:hypothetical protein [Muribaculaceae bacterium]MDE7111266.1 hypothetical protein [Muribaculaceae bacterium]
MNAELIVWIVIAGVCAMTFIYRLVASLLRHHSGLHLTRVVEIGSEAEEFFVPGDIIVRDNKGNDNDYDYDD